MGTFELSDISLTIRPQHLPAPGSPFQIELAPSARPQTPEIQRAFSIDHLNLTVPNGKTVVILGPSGCGKTTLLRVAAGLQQPDSGRVLLDGIDWQDVPTRDRGIGMVFQNYALYPFTPRRNVLSYFLFRRRTPQLDAEAAEKYRRTAELLGVEIEYLADRDIRKLSWGEKQRVALGRCITRDPKLFLLDEPFANLDAKLREHYRYGLRKLLTELKITTLYVTHDQQEALVIADLVAVMNTGTIEQVGTPEEVYTRPNSMFVAEFLSINAEAPAINFLDGPSVSGSVSGDWEGRMLGIRPEDFDLCTDGSPGWRAQVANVHSTPMSRTIVAAARLHGQDVVLRLPPGRPIQAGQEIELRVKRMHVFDTKSGRRIDTIEP